jgi:hypothetical protein
VTFNGIAALIDPMLGVCWLTLTPPNEPRAMES